MNKKILKHFKEVDLIIYETALKIELPEITKSNDYFSELVDTIVSQQLSGKAATTIFGRLKDLMPQKQITPQNIVKTNDEEIRSAGISYSKIKYIKGIAQEVISGNLNLNDFDGQSDEVVKKELIKLRGIGPWSAEMFLMFSLGREDVFSPGDQGLKNAIKKLYGFQKDPTEQEMLHLSGKWSPFRTYASRILWQSLNITPM